MKMQRNTMRIVLICWCFVVVHGSSTPVSIPLGSVSDLLIQSALDSLNADSPTHHTYKSGNLISAQKLVEPSPYVIYRLTLNLEPNCEGCSREACAIDLRQHTEGVIDVQRNSIQCMYLQRQSTVDEIQEKIENPRTAQEIETLERQIANDANSVRLDHEVQTVVNDGSERPFIAVRATDRSYCAGCPFELNPTLPGLVAFGEQVVRSMDNSGRSDFKHRVVSIVRVTRAVPPGSNVVKYELDLEIGETNCPRDSLVQRSECAPLTNIPIKLCRVTFEERPWLRDSRTMTRNNCTDLPDSDNSVSSSYEPSVIVGEASTTSLSSSQLREATPVLTAIYSRGDQIETARPSVNEEPIAKVVISTDRHEEGTTTGFTDKIREFDEFLEGFDIPIKNRPAEPEDHRVPVTEEVIRPEVVLRPSIQREPATMAVSAVEDTTRTKRDLVVGAPAQKSIDDPEVVAYARKALSKYSEISSSEYEPFLVEIVEASAQVVSGMLYKIRVKLGESNCPKGSKDNCQLRENSEVNEYLMTVWSQPWKDNGNPDIKIELQRSDDQIERVRRDLGTPGGPVVMNPNDPKIQDYAKKGLKKFSETSESANEPFLVEILEATSQVVSGMLYKIKVRLGESTCPKGTKEVCQLKDGSPVNNYLVTVWSQPWLDNGHPDVKVELHSENTRARRERRSGRLLGGVTELNPNDPEIRAYAERGLRKFSKTSQGQNEPYLVHIISATSQVVSGMLYKIKVRVGESDCPKGVNRNCQLKANSATNDYLITVWSQPWVDNGKPDVKIEPLDGANRQRRSLRGANYSAKMLNLHKEIQHERAFEDFLIKYEKSYTSEEEKNKRFKIFKRNMKTVSELQRNEQGTAVYGATMFADMTPEEFRAKHTGLRPELRSENQIPFPRAQVADFELPREFDWRHYNVVTEVKDQGQCGSCWAFAVTGNVEALYAIKTGKLLSLSEQELVDCDTLDEGCNGGLPDNAYRSIESLGGLELEADYPYDGEDEKCHFDKSKARVTVASGLNITTNETGMAQWLVKNGPISIAINANAMQFYMGGVSHPFKFLCSADNLDHGVLIVGYGVHTYPLFKKTMPYWIIKNSWGPSWGEQGYYRVYRGDGTCGLNKEPTSAVLG